jgi:hypothetical protein
VRASVENLRKFLIEGSLNSEMFAALSKAASAVSTAASNMVVAGIAVKNESSVPLLVIVSQLTPL